MELKKNNKFKGDALTFDDVLLVPAYSNVLPREVSTKTQLTRNIKLNVPIVSAAMDTVTDYKLAIAIARQGGIGMVHKNMSIEQQAEQIRRVKRSESGMILDPVTLTQEATLGEALANMKRHKIGGIPIVDENQQLVGILTNRDLRFETDLSKNVASIMTSEKLVTAPEGTNLDQAREILKRYKIEKLPVVDNHNRLVGLITYKDLMKLINYPNACKDQYGRLVVGGAVGVTKDMEQRIEAMVKVGVDVVCIDTARPGNYWRKRGYRRWGKGISRCWS